MVNFTKELPQNTTVIPSKHTEQYSTSSNDSAILRQSMISAVLHASLMPCFVVASEPIDIQVI